MPTLEEILTTLMGAGVANGPSTGPVPPQSMTTAPEMATFGQGDPESSPGELIRYMKRAASEPAGSPARTPPRVTPGRARARPDAEPRSGFSYHDGIDDRVEEAFPGVREEYSMKDVRVRMPQGITGTQNRHIRRRFIGYHYDPRAGRNVRGDPMKTLRELRGAADQKNQARMQLHQKADESDALSRALGTIYGMSPDSFAGVPSGMLPGLFAASHNVRGSGGAPFAEERAYADAVAGLEEAFPHLEGMLPDFGDARNIDRFLRIGKDWEEKKEEEKKEVSFEDAVKRFEAGDPTALNLHMSPAGVASAQARREEQKIQAQKTQEAAMKVHKQRQTKFRVAQGGMFDRFTNTVIAPIDKLLNPDKIMEKSEAGGSLEIFGGGGASSREETQKSRNKRLLYGLRTTMQGARAFASGVRYEDEGRLAYLPVDILEAAHDQVEEQFQGDVGSDAWKATQLMVHSTRYGVNDPDYPSDQTLDALLKNSGVDIESPDLEPFLERYLRTLHGAYSRLNSSRRDMSVPTG